MSSRDHSEKGSSRSRSDRDNSRGRRRWDERPERSRSPGHVSSKERSQERKVKSRSRSPNVIHKHSKNSHDNDKLNDSRSSSSPEDVRTEARVPAPPPPPRITKISMGFSKPPNKAPIKMSIGAPAAKAAPIAAPKPSIASVFNTDDDDEPEEMPAEARMRMRNIGRETPTSAGPNSFGKTKQGFCDAKKVFERTLKKAMEGESSTTPTPKFPQTIYKLQN